MQHESKMNAKNSVLKTAIKTWGIKKNQDQVFLGHLQSPRGTIGI
jgi:hypothetical protein